MGIFFNSAILTESAKKNDLIKKFKSNPESVPVFLEESTYYCMSSDINTFMDCSATFSVREALEIIAEANSINSKDIVVLEDNSENRYQDKFKCNFNSQFISLYKNGYMYMIREIMSDMNKSLGNKEELSKHKNDIKRTLSMLTIQVNRFKQLQNKIERADPNSFTLSVSDLPHFNDMVQNAIFLARAEGHNDVAKEIEEHRKKIDTEKHGTCSVSRGSMIDMCERIGEKLEYLIDKTEDILDDLDD